MIRSICLDLDGTLLDNNSLVSIDTKNYLIELLDNGIDVTIVTGRPYFYVKYLVNKLDPRIDFIASNGAVYTSHQEVIEHAFDRETLSTIVNFVKERPLMGFFKTLDTVYSKKDYLDLGPLYLNDVHKDLFKDLKRVIDNNYEGIFDESITTIFLGTYHQAQYEQVIAHLKQIETIDYAHTGDYMIDIIPKGINKGQAVKEMMAKKKIDLEHVMAFGDSDNDLEMLEVVGHPVVMKNGSTRALAMSDAHTEHTNDEEGVLKYLKKHSSLFNEKD